MPPASKRGEACLFFDDEVHAAILLHAAGVVLDTQRPIFAVTGNPQLRVQTELMQIGPDCPRPAFAQYDIVCGRTNFIASPLGCWAIKIAGWS